jgi:hypothetical protein
VIYNNCLENSQSLFVIDAGKCFGPVSYRTPLAVESPFCNTVSPGDGGSKHFPASVTNFESFPDNRCLSRDCRLTDYVISTYESVTFFLNCPVFPINVTFFKMFFCMADI